MRSRPPQGFLRYLQFLTKPSPLLAVPHLFPWISRLHPPPTKSLSKECSSSGSTVLGHPLRLNWGQLLSQEEEVLREGPLIFAPFPELWTPRQRQRHSLGVVCSEWGVGPRAFPHSSEPGAFLADQRSSAIIQGLQLFGTCCQETGRRARASPGERNPFPAQTKQ